MLLYFKCVDLVCVITAATPNAKEPGLTSETCLSTVAAQTTPAKVIKKEVRVNNIVCDSPPQYDIAMW